MRLVLDTSVAASWLPPHGKDADAATSIALLQKLREPDAQALVPVTWSLEVANVLARSESKGIVTANESQASIGPLVQRPIVVDEWPHFH